MYGIAGPHSVARIVASWRLDKANVRFSSPEMLHAGCKVTASVHGS